MRLEDDDKQAHVIMDEWMIARMKLNKDATDEPELYTLEQLMEPGEELETIAMSAAWNGTSYDASAYLHLRQNACLTDLCRAMMVRKTMDYRNKQD